MQIGDDINNFFECQINRTFVFLCHIFGTEFYFVLEGDLLEIKELKKIQNVFTKETSLLIVLCKIIYELM